MTNIHDICFGPIMKTMDSPNTQKLYRPFFRSLLPCDAMPCRLLGSRPAIVGQSHLSTIRDPRCPILGPTSPM
jgi:hypothetical protein